MSLYNKHRPMQLGDFSGNEGTVNSLRGVLQSREDAPHAMLFHGPTGCGKTTLGRIALRQLGCRGQDFRELDSAHFRGIDTVRQMRRKSIHRPMEGHIRGVLLDECHQLTKDAQHALLKELEDPPGHVYYVLATTEPRKLLPTIRSRCSEFAVAPLPEQVLVRLLYRIAKKEGQKVKRKLLRRIAEAAEGHPRQAVQTLEKVLATPPDERKAVIGEALAAEAEAIDLCRLLTRQGSTWRQVAKVLKGMRSKGVDPEGARRAVLGYCSAIVLNSGRADAAGIMEEFSEPFYDTGFPGLVLACYAVIHGEV